MASDRQVCLFEMSYFSKKIRRDFNTFFCPNSTHLPKVSDIYVSIGVSGSVGRLTHFFRADDSITRLIFKVHHYKDIVVQGAPL